MTQWYCCSWSDIVLTRYQGNLVEFETLVGEPLREGLSRGVLMPTLSFLYHTLKAMQWRLKEERGIIDIPAKGEYLQKT